MDAGPWPPHFEHAACRAPGIDPLWFFPDRGQPVDRARKICAGCPHQVPCAEWALAAPVQLSGMWGGLSQRDRLLARRQRRSRSMSIEPAGVVRDDGSDESIEDVTDVRSAVPVELNGSQPTAGTEPARRCLGCNKELTGQQTRWCSTSCKRRAEYGRSRQNPAAAPRTTQVARKPAGTVAGGLPGPLAALLGNGALVRSFVLDLGGEQWTLTRSTTNGRTNL